MLRYITRRLLQAIPTLLGVTIFSFLLMSLAPGGFVRLAFGENPAIRPQQRAQLEARMGLNDPLPVQYLRWLLGDDWMRRDTTGDGVADWSILIPLDADGDGINEPPGRNRGILRLDFGESFSRRRPVVDLIGERVAATLELGVTALLVSLSIGLPIGILAAVWKGTWFDNASRVLSVVVSAIPTFWLGLMLILIFSITLKNDAGRPLLPMIGRCSITAVGGCPPIYMRLEYLIMPVIVLSSGGIAIFSRFMRASMLDVINQDYIRTARAKGLSNRNVWFKHGARNALIPIATILGPSILGVLGGAVITETVFSWPGMGRFAVEAVFAKDYPVVMTTVVIGAVTTVLGFLLSDILYAVVDPRIRFN